jgi:protein-S-isoprenylcysteine O-methyltransferase Ste14
MAAAPDEKKTTAGVVAPPPVIFGLMFVMGALLERYVRRIPLFDHHELRWLSALFFAVGALGMLAVMAMVRAGTTPNPYQPTTALVTGGPYRITRNPMYVGFTAWYIGLAIALNMLWPLLLLPLALVLMTMGVIVREEAYLTAKFGEDYRAYRARVRRWL